MEPAPGALGHQHQEHLKVGESRKLGIETSVRWGREDEANLLALKSSMKGKVYLISHYPLQRQRQGKILLQMLSRKQ